jgi:hypothetical protein
MAVSISIDMRMDFHRHYLHMFIIWSKTLSLRGTSYLVWMFIARESSDKL